MSAARNPITQEIEFTRYFENEARYWGIRVFEHKGQATVVTRQGRVGQYSSAHTEEGLSIDDALRKAEEGVSYYLDKGSVELDQEDKEQGWRLAVYKCFGVVDVMPTGVGPNLATQLGVAYHRPQDAPRVADALNEATNILIDQNLFEDAADCLTWALVLVPEHTGNRLLRAYSYGALGFAATDSEIRARYREEAVGDCDVVLSSEPDNELAQQYKAQIPERLGMKPSK